MSEEIPTESGQTPHARQVLWLTGIGHALAHSWELIFPAVAVPIAIEFGLPYEAVLPVAFASFLLFGLGAAPAGWLTDRIGGRAVLIACLGGIGVGGVLVFLSTSLTVLGVALALLGLAASLYHPAGLAVLSRSFAKRGRAFAINGIAGNVGIAATPLLAGLIAATLGWRWAYLLLCLPGLVGAAVFLFLPHFDDRAGLVGSSPLEEVPRVSRSVWIPIALFGLALTAGGLAYRLHTLVVPKLFAERLPGLVSWFTDLGLPGVSNPDNVVGTAVTSAAYAMGIAGQWIGGKVADRYPLLPAYMGFHAASLILVGTAATLFGLPLTLVIFAYLFFAIGMQPIENSIVADLTPTAWRGKAYAGKFVLNFGFGATGAFVVGLVHPYGGLAAALVTAAALEVIVIGAAWAALRSRN